MRKYGVFSILVLGLVFLALLGIPSVAAADVEDSGSISLNANQYWQYTVYLPNGGGVEYDIQGDNLMNIYFLDEYNMNLYASGQSFQYIEAGTSLNTQHAKIYFTIDESAGGTYYIVVEPTGNPLNFTYTIKYGENYETSFLDFFGAWGIMGCLAGAVIFIIWIYVLYWVYKDAKRRGSNHPLLWVLVVFFLSLLGLILYLVLRPKKSEQKRVYQAPPPPPQ